MASDGLLEQLANAKLPFVRKLQLAALAELDYWEDRRDPPNLSIQEFRSLLNYIPAGLQPSWRERESSSGPHGDTGETQVFKFEFEVSILGRRSRYFVKGYFFDADRCRGVTIQSFRRISLPRLRAV